jgi:hypothetical protein
MVELDHEALQGLRKFADKQGIDVTDALKALIHAFGHNSGVKIVSLSISPGVSLRELAGQLSACANEIPDALVVPSGASGNVGTVIGSVSGGSVRIRQKLSF